MTPPTSLEYSVVDSVGVLAGQLDRSIYSLVETAREIAENTRYRYVAVVLRGKSRQLWVPDDSLKYLQRDICEFFVPASDLLGPQVNGFARNRSNRTNAAIHVGQVWVQKFDLKDFFSSVSSDQVLIAIRSLGIADEPSKLLAGLTTYLGSLPQGAPSSPILSNLVLAEVDNLLLQLAKEHHLTYSRYADDLTFGGAELFDLSGAVSQAVARFGFQLNASKTRLAGPGHPRFVTGLFVDDKQLRLRKSFKRDLARHLYFVEKFGMEEHAHRMDQSPHKLWEQLRGRVHYANQTEPLWVETQRRLRPQTMEALLPPGREEARKEHLHQRREAFLVDIEEAARTAPLRYQPTYSFST